MKNIYLIGASGTIGKKVLNLIDNNKEFKLVAVSVGKNIEFLKEIINKYHPLYVSTIDKNDDLKNKYPHIKFYHGEEGLIHILNHKMDNSIFFNAILGSVGLKPTIYAIKRGYDIAMANKESIVVGGYYLMNLVKANNVNFIPVDSEHNALYQLLDDNLDKVYITASGGAIRDLNKDDYEIEEVLKHPNWKMGNKITVDSSTMVNKALEIIEAHYLFGISYDKLNAIINKESMVHCIIKYKDGTYKSLMSNPDMDIPISYALKEDKRFNLNYNIDFSNLNLHFSLIDDNKYPCFKLILDYAKKGDIFPIVASITNEYAVKMFLSKKIKFNQIYDIIKEELQLTKFKEIINIEEILYFEKEFRLYLDNKYGGLL